jgi:membrane-associated phospholipid phosphatase
MTIRIPTQSPRILQTPVKIEPQTSSPVASVSALSRASGSAPSPIVYDASPAPVPLWRRAAPWLVGFLVCCAWDRAIWLMVTSHETPKLEWLEELMKGDVFWTSLKGAVHLDLHAAGNTLLGAAYGALYMFGRLWPWIFLAVYFIFRHWAGTDGSKVREGMRRGVFVFLVPALAGLLAEGLKLITRRERPEMADGWYAFLPWPKASLLSPEFWSPSNLGLASSHAAVAFGGALAAGLLLPKWRVPLLVLAALCTIGRIGVGAHFLSDAFAGVACAFGMFALVYALDRRNNGGRAIVA